MRFSGQGLFDGFGAVGLQIGSGVTAAPVNIVGGVRVVGSVSADAFQGDATAIHITDGANVPEIRNEDFIEASISHSVAATTDLATTASGILIDAGASVSTISNFGTLQATANSDNAKAYALRDLSGNVTSVLNEGVISAVVTPITAGLSLPSSTNLEPDIAIDLSAKHHRRGPDPNHQPDPDRGGGDHHHQLHRRGVDHRRPDHHHGDHDDHHHDHDRRGDDDHDNHHTDHARDCRRRAARQRPPTPCRS